MSHTVNVGHPGAEATAAAPTNKVRGGIFAGVSRHVLRDVLSDGNGQALKVFEPELDRLQLQILELPAISPAAFTLAGTSRS